MTEQVPAAVRYKEIAAAATAAAQQMRRQDREKATELEKAVAAGDARKQQDDEQHEKHVKEIRTRWNLAMEALWDERWLEVTSLPSPNRSAPPATPEQSRRVLQDAYLELRSALDKTRWSAGSLLPRRKGSKAADESSAD